MTFSFFYPCYLPRLQELANLIYSDLIFFTDHFQFVKRSCLTRTRLSPSGAYLSIPVEHGDGFVPIFRKKIRQDEKWTENHLRTIYHLYHKLPFFDYYYPLLQEIFHIQNTYLSPLLYHLLQFYKKAYQLPGEIKIVSELFSGQLSTDLLLKKIIGNFPVTAYGAIADTDALCPKLDNIGFNFTKEIPLPNTFPYQLNSLEFLCTFGSEAAYLLRTA